MIEWLINILKYNTNIGVKLLWIDDFQIITQIENNAIVWGANITL